MRFLLLVSSLLMVPAVNSAEMYDLFTSVEGDASIELRVEKEDVYRTLRYNILGREGRKAFLLKADLETDEHCYAFIVFKLSLIHI